MKLIIQIPCLDEEETLPVTLADLPREVAGFDVVEWLVIDDGSTDRTIDVARTHGVDHIVRLTNNKGLASSFQAGLDASLKLGADVIVNTDADNQYFGGDIPKLVAPVLDRTADVVVGTRPLSTISTFSPVKKGGVDEASVRAFLREVASFVEQQEVQARAREVYRKAGVPDQAAAVIFFHGLGLSHMDLEQATADGRPNTDWVLQDGMVAPVHLLYPGGEHERMWLEEVIAVSEDGGRPLFSWGFEALTGR